MLSFSSLEKSRRSFKKFALDRVLLVPMFGVSYESATKGVYYFKIFIPPSAFGLTGSRCLWKRIWIVSIISLVVSTGLLEVLSSPISFGLIISTALSAFLKKGKAF
jgi:hypothetical protein